MAASKTAWYQTPEYLQEKKAALEAKRRRGLAVPSPGAVIEEPQRLSYDDEQRLQQALRERERAAEISQNLSRVTDDLRWSIRRYLGADGNGGRHTVLEIMRDVFEKLKLDGENND